MRYVELDTLTRWLLVNLINLYIFYSKVGFLIFLHFRVSFGVQYIIKLYLAKFKGAWARAPSPTPPPPDPPLQ